MKITLCGSTRFMDQWHEWNEKLSSRGHVVYSLARFRRDLHDAEERPETTDGKLKGVLDLVHLAKIEESEVILVLNYEDYIGESTKRELLWARIRGKRVLWAVAGSKHRQAGEPSYDEFVHFSNAVGDYIEEIARKRTQT